MADENETLDDAPKGGKKKLIIIVAVAVVLLLSGAAAAYFLLADDEPAGAESEEAASAEPAVDEGDPVYHKLGSAMVVNLPPGGPAGMLQIAIEVMTRTPSVVDTLSANDPMIRHHVINLLEQQSADSLLTMEGKQALQTAIDELLSEQLERLEEPGEIKGVFFTQFVLQ